MKLSVATLCIECHYAERQYAECYISFIVMLNVVMLNVIMLNVVAPLDWCSTFQLFPSGRGS
jgi:hypothetical protein